MSTLLQDTFTGTVGTNLTAHTMNVGPGWTTPVGIWILNGSNQAQLTTAVADALAYADSGQSDVIITLDVLVNSFSLAGICARMTNSTNGWFFYIQSTGGTPSLNIVQMIGGSATVLSSVFLPNAVNTTVTLTVTLNGTSLIVAADTGETTSYTSSGFQTNTIMGLYAYGDFGVGPNIVDNFLVINSAVATNLNRLPLLGVG